MKPIRPVRRAPSIRRGIGVLAFVVVASTLCSCKAFIDATDNTLGLSESARREKAAVQERKRQGTWDTSTPSRPTPPPGWKPEQLDGCRVCMGLGSITFDPVKKQYVTCEACGGRGQIPKVRNRK